jgi:hypothetical protein
MVSLSFARNYGYAYWGSIGVLVALIAPLDPTIVGSSSILGPMAEMFPAQLDTTHLWLGHAWGIAMLGFCFGNYLAPRSVDSDLSFVRGMAVMAALWNPCCAYAFWNDFGFFWKVFYPVVHSWNTYVYVSGGFMSPEAKAADKKSKSN